MALISFVPSGDQVAPPGVVEEHQEQAKLLGGQHPLQRPPHLPRCHLLNTRSTKSLTVRILAKGVSAGFQRVLEQLLISEGSLESEVAASLLPPFLLFTFGVAEQFLLSSQARSNQAMVPLTMKLTTVIYGHPDRCTSHSAYQVQPR